MFIKKTVLIVFCVVIFETGCAQNTRKETIEMAKKFDNFDIASVAAKELGYDLEKMNCIDRSSEWANMVGGEEFGGLNKILKGKDFVVIYCSSKDKTIRGGDLNIFIDKKQGKVIKILQGQ